MTNKRVFVFGIDGAPPELVFDKWLSDLPTIKSLMDKGCYAKLNSTVPPSTILAWSSMLSGKNPGEFDVFSYTFEDPDGQMKLISSENFKSERIWDHLTKLDKESIFLNVPLTYPIQEFKGYGAAGFLTPQANEKSLYPKEFLGLIKEKFPNYKFDVSVGLASYKNLDKKEMIEGIYDMTETQIDVLKYLIQNKKWEFFIWVCIGTDRLQHTMWSYFDHMHNDFKGETEFKETIKDYYKYLDKKLSEILLLLDDETTIIVASDHGFNRMDGRVNLNDWLRKEGYLVLKDSPKEPERLVLKNVDWEKTKAHALGAYFGRIYFNKKSRSNHGILEDHEIEELQGEIITKLKNFTRPDGEAMKMIFHKPQEVYTGEFIKNSPDLYVYFDNLIFGVNNDVGNKGLYSKLTLIGSDEGGHAPQGIFIMSGNNVKSKGNLGEIDITDVAPTIFDKLEIEQVSNGRKIE